jgi:hypothetical protein
MIRKKNIANLKFNDFITQLADTLKNPKKQ